MIIILRHYRFKHVVLTLIDLSGILFNNISNFA